MKPGIFKYGNYGWLGEYRAHSIISAAKRIRPEIEVDPVIPIDIFHSCYLLNTTHEQMPAEIAMITETILKDKEVRKITIADDLISRVFAVKFLLALEKELEKRQQEGQGKQGTQGLEQVLQQITTGEKKDASEEQKKTAQEAKKLFEQAMKEAKKETEQIKLYAGLKAGVGHSVTFGELMNLQQFAVDLRELLRLFRDISSIDFSKSLKVAPFGSYEGIKFGKDLSKITPAQLAMPEELFWYRFATSTLHTVETKATEMEEFLLLVDKSGSMRHGNKTLWSRAVALALAMHAKKNNLRCSLAFFDDTVCQPRPIDLLSEFDEAFKWILTLECKGGTKIDKVLQFADRQTARKVLLVTDGEDEVRHKPEKTLISVMIEGNNETLKKISADYLQVKPNKTGALQFFKSLKGD